MIEEQILEQKQEYTCTLDNEILEKITELEMKKKTLQIKVEVMQETLKQIGKVETVDIDYKKVIEKLMKYRQKLKG